MNATMAPSAELAAPARRGVDATSMVLAAAWALLTAAAAYRWLGVGRDYADYIYYFEYIPPQLSFEDTRFEPGFHFVAWFFRHVLNASYADLVLAVSGVALGIKFYLFRKHLAHPILAAITYVTIFYPSHEYTQIRVAIGLALGYAAVHFLLDRRYRIGIPLFVLGFLFHTSVVLLAAAYFASRYARGNLATVMVIGGSAIAFLFSEDIRRISSDLFSSYNPLLRGYIENREFIEELRLTSVNNLLLIAALASAVLLGWFKLGRYHSTFLTISIAAVVALVVFSNAPVVGQRSKEVLFVAVVFLIYRSRITLNRLPPIAFIWVNAALLLYLSFRENLITL